MGSSLQIGNHFDPEPSQTSTRGESRTSEKPWPRWMDHLMASMPTDGDKIGTYLASLGTSHTWYWVLGTGYWYLHVPGKHLGSSLHITHSTYTPLWTCHGKPSLWQCGFTRKTPFTLLPLSPGQQLLAWNPFFILVPFLSSTHTRG